MLEVSVKDHGIGISQEDQSKLFKLFGRLDSSLELNTNGIGLGLHISKMITASFGGSLRCSSCLGAGSTFSFDFVLDKPNDKSANDRTWMRWVNPHPSTY
mmetsp:Transcript_24122/g.37042  ORF Transcript_24122/g.37042 Transcript_24122/m.37042 type:complete len:100 (+) Transcript_24122:2170-2469(+)